MRTEKSEAIDSLDIFFLVMVRMVMVVMVMMVMVMVMMGDILTAVQSELMGYRGGDWQIAK